MMVEGKKQIDNSFRQLNCQVINYGLGRLSGVHRLVLSTLIYSQPEHGESSKFVPQEVLAEGKGFILLEICRSVGFDSLLTTL